MRYTAATTLLAAILPTLAAQSTTPAEGPTEGRLREVRVTTGDVFAAESAAKRPLERLLNGLHWETREEVVHRECWFAPGEPITAEGAAELERNLRALGLFADVAVRLVATGTPGEVDLEVVTRDRLSLIFGAGASYVGGVTGFRAAVGESNVLGYGNRIGLSFAQNSEDEFRGSLAYTDLHVLDTWHTAGIRLSRTDEGDSVGVDFRRPFKHLADPRSYGVAASHDVADVDYFSGGDSVATVQDHHAHVGTDLLWATGPIEARSTAGLTLTYDRDDYSPATGPLAPEIRVPGDTWSVFVGPTARVHWITGYRKVEGLDTLVYIQDLTLGLEVGATLGVRWRDEQGAAADLQPEFRLDTSWASEPITDLFTNFTVNGAVRLDDGEAVGWSGSAAARAFAAVSERNTLAMSWTFDAVEETQDLPRQLTLGEDNGLRGYPAREFAGTQRLRTNVEDRFDTGVEFATMRFGLVGFFDTGWVGDDGNLGQPWSSFGAGLRIGSKPLLGQGILRIDLAKPLDEVDGEDGGWQVSVSVGQVFTFGGNSSTLGVR